MLQQTNTINRTHSNNVSNRVGPLHGKDLHSTIKFSFRTPFRDQLNWKRVKCDMSLGQSKACLEKGKFFLELWTVGIWAQVIKRTDRALKVSQSLKGTGWQISKGSIEVLFANYLKVTKMGSSVNNTSNLKGNSLIYLAPGAGHTKYIDLNTPDLNSTRHIKTNGEYSGVSGGHFR